MKIKTQFINSMVIFGIILLIIATSVIVTNQQVERLNKQEEIAKNIERGASELGYLSNDYLLYHESPQRARWESKFSELSDDMSNLNPNSPEQQTLVNNIRSNQQRLKAVFADAVSTFENTSQGADPALFQISWSRMAVQNQGMAFDAARLSQILRDQADQLKQTNATLISALLVILGLYFLTNYLIVYRSALKSISELQDGTRIIGSGNFDFAIKQKNDDEIGELSHAFNKMTANLKNVTASKTELEREITERKRAENALRESEQRYATTLASIGDAVIATDVEGRITFINAVAEALTGWTLAEASTKPVKEVFNIINEHTRAEVEDPVTRVLKEGTIIGLANHTILVRKDGTEVPIDDSGAPIRDRDGKTMGVVLVFRDITERKRAEEALRESEERLRFALETSHIGAWDLNLVDHAAHRSLEHDHIFGYEQLLPQWTYEMFLDHVLPEDRATVDAKFLKATAAHSDWDFECRIRRVDGEVRWIWAAGRHQEDATGSARRMAGIVQDITERKRAEEALARSSRRVSEILESITDGFMAIDNGWRFTYANQRAASNLGLKPEDLIGQNIWEKFPEIKGTNHEIYYRKTMQQHEPQYFEMHGVLTDKWYEIRVYPSAEGISVFWQDTTERKRAEEALRKAHDELELRVQERTIELKEANKALMESEASYRELTESIDDLFYAMDGELRYTYWNKASEALTGILEKDAIGKSLYELFPDIKGTKMEQFYIEALKIQQPQRFESQFQLGDKKFIFEINAYPTKNGLSIIAKDITEKKMFEAHLLRAQRMESIGTLAGGIAHDLNNMLTPIMMSLQMFKKKYKDEQSQRLLTILENNSQRSADLIKQVLSFARGVEGERNPLAAKHIITEIEKISKETFPRNIEIRTDILKDLFTVSGDATQLHQVIMNLCVNARDAMPNGGVLNISAKNFFIDENYSRMHTEAKIGSYIIVEVSDTGTGIPPKILDRIFEPFFTTKEFGKGTGLGLSTALAIVKSHGGFINVNSEIGKGTTFGVYLPAIKTEMQNIDEQEPELLIGHGELVLVAEDEDSVREVTISTLEKNGYRVLTACDGVEAISSYAQNMNETKVILMDMMMPVMDGHAGIRAIRKINTEVKIIAVSGLTEKEKLKNVADYSNAFLPKPYTAERLLKTIHDVLSAK